MSTFFCFHNMSTLKVRNNTNYTGKVQQRRFRDLTYVGERGPLRTADEASREQTPFPPLPYLAPLLARLHHVR
jgi:hypothetical protein